MIPSFRKSFYYYRKKRDIYNNAWRRRAYHGYVVYPYIHYDRHWEEFRCSGYTLKLKSPWYITMLFCICFFPAGLPALFMMSFVDEDTSGFLVLLFPLLYYLDWINENFNYFFNPSIFSIDYGSIKQMTI